MEKDGGPCDHGLCQDHIRASQQSFFTNQVRGTIHYHDTFPLEIWPEKAIDNIKKAADGREYVYLTYA